MYPIDREEIIGFETLHRLILNDLGSLAIQVLKIDSKPDSLKEIASNLNFAFEQAGQGTRFEAIVESFAEPIYKWQVDGLE